MHTRTLALIAALALPSLIAARLFPAQDAGALILGEGEHRFEWVRNWGVLPEGVTFGNTNGCIVTDSAGRVYINTDSERAVIVFEADGRFVGTWGEDLAGGLHGMCVVEEADGEFLYFTHTGRHMVAKATLEGELLWTLGYPEVSGIYASENAYKPTSIAVAADGGFFVADGYGKSWIHQYDRKRKYVRSFAGPGGEAGKTRTPHGLSMDLRGDEPLLLVSDRENNRLQWFDLSGEAVRTLEGGLRRPCHTDLFGDELVVAELAGRVSLFDGEGELIARLGDNPDPNLRANNGVPRERWVAGEFLAPHCVHFDAEGNVYVMDWNALGRISKLRRLD